MWNEFPHTKEVFYFQKKRKEMLGRKTTEIMTVFHSHSLCLVLGTENVPVLREFAF